MSRRSPCPTLFPYTTLFRSIGARAARREPGGGARAAASADLQRGAAGRAEAFEIVRGGQRSEEHTSELQSPDHLVCRPLLEKKKWWAWARRHDHGRRAWTSP